MGRIEEAARLLHKEAQAHVGQDFYQSEGIQRSDSYEANRRFWYNLAERFSAYNDLGVL